MKLHRACRWWVDHRAANQQEAEQLRGGCCSCKNEGRAVCQCDDERTKLTKQKWGWAGLACGRNIFWSLYTCICHWNPGTCSVKHQAQPLCNITVQTNPCVNCCHCGSQKSPQKTIHQEELLQSSVCLLLCAQHVVVSPFTDNSKPEKFAVAHPVANGTSDSNVKGHLRLLEDLLGADLKQSGKSSSLQQAKRICMQANPADPQDHPVTVVQSGRVSLRHATASEAWCHSCSSCRRLARIRGVVLFSVALLKGVKGC